MPQCFDLSGQWSVMFSDGMHGVTSSPMHEFSDTERCIKVPVPMDLHLALREHGLTDDYNYGMNYLHQRWIEEQFWQYRHVFEAPKAALKDKQHIWLVFEKLDLISMISLNGEVIGGHASVHRPCRIDITGKLREGENILIVTIESGLHYVADKEGYNYGGGLDTLLNKRHWLRKPQYEFGWDWNARLVNVGISGPVRLEWAENCRVDQVAVWAQPNEKYTKAHIKVRAFIEGFANETPFKANLCATILETGVKSSKPIEIIPGTNVYELDLIIEKPKLWQPIGHGNQPLYTVEVVIESGRKAIEKIQRRFGVRRIEINRSKHPETGEYFIIEVNGKPIFCKGGNWVPADMIGSTVTRERIRELVQIAVDANFNTLRIWGGGCWAGHDLLDACDEMGILVWHDLLFACSKYPGDHPEFLAEIRNEVTYGTREFCIHPSLIVWCGNNELEWGVFAWNYDKYGKSLPDYALFHHVIPVILREEDPINRPYWPSSPYSPDYIFPNDPTVGDQHPWGVTLQVHGADFWHYRTYVDRFPNEGGILGATSPKTLRGFLPEEQQWVRSPVWERHDNAANFWTQHPGVTYQLVELWLGRKHTDMSFDEYVFASALLQAEGLQEYINNYHRRMFGSSSAIFWMYNDSWPTTHGWTIIDYFLRKKLSYHPVRRAFAPVNVVVAEEGDQLVVFGINDGSKAWKGELCYGLFNLDGGSIQDTRIKVEIPAYTSKPLASIPTQSLKKLGLSKAGAFGCLYEKTSFVAQHRLFLERFKSLDLRNPNIQIETKSDHQGNHWFELTSDVFVWGVCLDLDGELPLPDNCFDLLPGIPYILPCPESMKNCEISIYSTGNALVLAKK